MLAELSLFDKYTKKKQNDTIVAVCCNYPIYTSHCLIKS